MVGALGRRSYTNRRIAREELTTLANPLHDPPRAQEAT